VLDRRDATLALLKNIPVYSCGIEAELVTPTGACLIKNLSSGFGSMPEMKISEVGYGAGSRELTIPNFLRVYIGEAEDIYESDETILIETNIDDMTPEALGYVQEKLLSLGAKDVFMTSILMKKNRLGVMLSVLIEPKDLERLLDVIFEETTSLGVRINHVGRKKLFREVVSVKTEFGNVDVKVGRSSQGIMIISPEYESCRKIALKRKIPFNKVYLTAKATAEEKLTKE